MPPSRCSPLRRAAADGGGTASKGEIEIWSSLPRQGSSKAQTDTIVNAINMAIEEKAGGKAGGYTIVYKDVDDSTAAAGKWDEATEIKNANDAVANDKLVAYIGTFNSGAAKLSIPILCGKGIVMISPANTGVGLTKPFEEGEPDKYYPNGCKKNYTRVIPDDDLQGERWREVGVPARAQERLHPRRHRGLRQGHRRRLRFEGCGVWPDRPRPRWHRRQGVRLQGPGREDQGHQPRPRLLRRDHPEQRRPAVARPARRDAGRQAHGSRRHLRGRVPRGCRGSRGRQLHHLRWRAAGPADRQGRGVRRQVHGEVPEQPDRGLHGLRLRGGARSSSRPSSGLLPRTRPTSRRSEPSSSTRSRRRRTTTACSARGASTPTVTPAATTMSGLIITGGEFKFDTVIE